MRKFIVLSAALLSAGAAYPATWGPIQATSGNATADLASWRVTSSAISDGGPRFSHADLFDLVTFAESGTFDYALRLDRAATGDGQGITWFGVADVTGRLDEFEGYNDAFLFSEEIGAFRDSRIVQSVGFGPDGWPYDTAETAKSLAVIAGNTYAMRLLSWVLAEDGSASLDAAMEFSVPPVMSAAPAPVPLPAGLPLLIVGIAALIAPGSRRWWYAKAPRGAGAP